MCGVVACIATLFHGDPVESVAVVQLVSQAECQQSQLHYECLQARHRICATQLNCGVPCRPSLFLQTQWNVKEALPSAPLRYFNYMPLMHSEQLQDQRVRQHLLCWCRVSCKPACLLAGYLAGFLHEELAHAFVRQTPCVCSPRGQGAASHLHIYRKEYAHI